jgi:hypothetical protein
MNILLFLLPKKVTKKARFIFYTLKFCRDCLIVRIAIALLGNAPLSILYNSLNLQRYKKVDHNFEY